MSARPGPVRTRTTCIVAAARVAFVAWLVGAFVGGCEAPRDVDVVTPATIVPTTEPAPPVAAAPVTPPEPAPIVFDPALYPGVLRPDVELVYASAWWSFNDDDRREGQGMRGRIGYCRFAVSERDPAALVPECAGVGGLVAGGRWIVGWDDELRYRVSGGTMRSAPRDAADDAVMTQVASPGGSRERGVVQIDGQLYDVFSTVSRRDRGRPGPGHDYGSWDEFGALEIGYVGSFGDTSALDSQGRELLVARLEHPTRDGLPEEVNEWLRRWTRAQAQMDFPTYIDLYAPTFRGVRRSAERVVPLDYGGWREDRRSMFERPVDVEIDVLTARSDDDEAVAVVMQRWTSPTWADLGPKVFVWRRTDGVWRAEYEDMLYSQPL